MTDTSVRGTRYHTGRCSSCEQTRSFTHLCRNVKVESKSHGLTKMTVGPSTPMICQQFAGRQTDKPFIIPYISKVTQNLVPAECLYGE